MKRFKTDDIDVVKSCQLYFGFRLPSEEWVKRAKNEGVYSDATQLNSARRRVELS